MINRITQPQCYNAFYSSKSKSHNNEQESGTPAKVKTGVLLGAAAGALGAAFLLSKYQSRALKKHINLLTVKYDEIAVEAVATSAIAGGLLAGLALDDKKYRQAKIKEGIHQAIANVTFPILLIGAANRLYEKIKPAIKLPQLKPSKGLKKFVNNAIKVAPHLAITIAGLVGGVCLGTKVSNKINAADDQKFKPRKVKPIDFIYHPDDIATAFVLSDKDGMIQKVAGKIIPLIFTLCGYETGIKR